MHILLLGGTGFIGSAVLNRLIGAGHTVVATARDAKAARGRWPDVRWVARDIGAMTHGRDWAPLLIGVDAVVNCAGVLQDGTRDDVAAVQSAAPRALFATASACGIECIVQVSATGADTHAPTLFLRSKGEADAALAKLPGDWVILRPGLVLGPQAYGGSALLRALAAMPYVLPVVRGTGPMQTVHVEDVAQAVLDAVEGRIASRASYDLVELRGHALEEILAALRAWLGLKPARILRVPGWVARPVFLIGDALGHLGWRSPLRSAAWAEAARGVKGNAAPWIAATGHGLRGLEETLRAMPATVQERWFARMWPMKAVAIGTLSAFWIASGAIGFARFGAAADVLTAHGVDADQAMSAVALGSVVDIALGAALLVRRCVKPAALGMVLTTLCYLAGATFLTPALWLDPLGPLVKTIPAAVLALVVLAVATER